MPDTFSLHLQPSVNGEGALNRLGEIAAAADWRSITVSVAYATEAGAKQLAAELAARWPHWASSRKVFLVGLDFGLTEPNALVYLRDLPNSRCFVYDAYQTLASRLQPLNRYHSKIYIFGLRARLQHSSAVAGIVGSTNLTAAGLLTNYEAFVTFSISDGTAQGRQWLAEVSALQTMALNADPVTNNLLLQYSRMRRHTPIPREPVERLPTWYTPRSEISDELLRGLRTARGFWTETLKIVENLGKGNPGNQVDLKKGARAFFGSNVPLNAPVNTPLGTVRTIAPNGAVEYHAMRYGDNGMDKINLPLPGGGNPAQYDYRYLLWTRVGDGRTFRLSVRPDGNVWRRRSDTEGTLFDYAGGRRQWGFFGGTPPLP